MKSILTVGIVGLAAFYTTFTYATIRDLAIPEMSHRWPMLHEQADAQVVQNPNEPPEMPQGVYCTHSGDEVYGVQTDHKPCACDIVMRAADPRDPTCCDIQVNNDPQCTQYCHEPHCKCLHRCLPPDTPQDPNNKAPN